MKLCRADITSKNDSKVKKYLLNFDKVEEKMIQVEASDKMRDFQPVVTGDMIMETFDIKPSKEVGIIKTAIREAILDGYIKNELQPCFEYMIKLGKKFNLVAIKSSDDYQL